MAFHLQVSNSLDQLASLLSESVQSQQPGPFQPVYIITQTEGMNSWLKLQIAHSTGIAANIEFLKPNEFINKIYYLMGGSSSDSLSAQDLMWIIYQLLGETKFIESYPNIAAYYHYDGIDKEVKRMGLAEKVADLFDQYQIYRADMIEEWNILPDKIIEDQWQKELWLRAKEVAGEIFPDKTLIGNYIKSGLSNPEKATYIQQKMPVAYLFGISVITQYHLQVFQHLSARIDINFLIVNPSPYDYWFEDRSEKLLYFLKKKGRAHESETVTGNPLLLGWGKIIQDTFSLLFENEELINDYDTVDSHDPPRDTLLHKIQHSVFQNTKEEKENYYNTEDIADGSITINSCYSPAREVEVLYNFLVQLAGVRKEKISSRDIVVMVSDVNLYASYIKAVFDNAPYRFKYTIADENYAASDSITNALHSVLSVSERNFTAEEVVRLLDFSDLRQRFGITDIAAVRNAVNEANIRFGIEGRRSDDSDYVSWKYGLQRIMYGLCISGEEEYGEGPASFYTLDTQEGAGTQNIIRFVYFVQQLITSLKERDRPRSISGWVKYVENILHDFVCDKEENTDEDYGVLLNQLEHQNNINELFTEEISYEVFMHSFLKNLSGNTRSSSFAGGGITFCSLIPMRSIPFKVVALLGMNFDQFPRKEKKVSFNLIENETRKGDRNVKENDKHLFLETLLSAKDYFYLSYLGQSEKDNSIFPPSILVDELISYIESVSREPGLVRPQIITRHPLHGFSNKYLQGDERYYNYLFNPQPGVEVINKKEIKPPFIEEVPLYKLINFLKNPIKGYYQEVLGIYYNDEEVTLRDTEVFELDHLDTWQLKNLLLKHDSNQAKELTTRLVKTGALPLKNMANVVLADVEQELSPVKKIFDSLSEGKPETTLSIELNFKNGLLKGDIENIYGNELIAVSFSKNENKYLLQAYINYLAALAAGHHVQLSFISQKENRHFPATPITPEDAYSRLEGLMELYKAGHEKIFAFDPDFGIEPKNLQDLTWETFNTKVSACKKNIFLEKEFSNGFFDDENTLENYLEIASQLLLPLAQLFPDYSFKTKK